MCETTVDFRRGDRYPDIVLLGACPGRLEYNAVPQRPFSGKSGQNLSMLLDVLSRLLNKLNYGFRDDDFQSTNPDHYTLMNSHPEPKWKARDDKSLPLMSEVGSEMNIQRLTNQLQAVNARIVVGLGRPLDNAKLAIRGEDSAPMRAIRLLAPQHRQISFCLTGHPSPRGINAHCNGNRELWFRNLLCNFPPQ
jgi:uracil-DNA glycosylase